MIGGTLLVIIDTLEVKHEHIHEHIIKIKENGVIKEEKIIHSHLHNHFVSMENHHHFHHKKELLNH